jgi:hypothetical protein
MRSEAGYGLSLSFDLSALSFDLSALSFEL